jgi:hypothetical protein
MTHSMFKDQPFKRNWLIFCITYQRLNTRDELLRLIAWAQKKQLRGPLRAYQETLSDIDALLRWSKQEVPAAQLAVMAQHLSKLVRRHGRYYTGAASDYRRKSIDNMRKVNILKPYKT